MLRSFAFLLAAPLLISAAPSYDARVAAILAKTPLIDGHNDWAETLVDKAGDKRWTMDLRKLDPKQYNTDITRLRAGHVGGQFWSVYVSANLSGPDQVRATLEQIGLMREIVRRYPNDFALATTAAEVRRIHAAGKIASMFGVEGGGQIDGSFSVLRAYRSLGASYLTLTHSKTIAWADSATDDPKHGGLTKFGEAVVHELNRLGMLVDLSHVNEDTMLDALRVTKAPVIFSHSSARGVDDSPRNVSDKVLKLVAANGGVVMVNYAPGYVSEARRRWDADRNAERGRYYSPPYGGLYIGQPERGKAALAQWEKDHPRPVVTLSQVADHIEYIVKVAGIDSVGLGGDLDGTGGDLPEGLDGVDTYPALLAELMKRGWSDEMIAKLAGGNILRVMAAAERTAASMASEPPATGTIEAIDGQ